MGLRTFSQLENSQERERESGISGDREKKRRRKSSLQWPNENYDELRTEWTSNELRMKFEFIEKMGYCKENELLFRVGVRWSGWNRKRTCCAKLTRERIASRKQQRFRKHFCFSEQRKQVDALLNSLLTTCEKTVLFRSSLPFTKKSVQSSLQRVNNLHFSADESAMRGLIRLDQRLARETLSLFGGWVFGEVKTFNWRELVRRLERIPSVSELLRIWIGKAKRKCGWLVRLVQTVH